VTEKALAERCVICGNGDVMTVDPPRRTLARGTDPSDSSYSVTVVLPDVHLCGDHHREFRTKELVIGWCDDELCRIYGAVGAPSPCGKDYLALKR
jgi:hypothetical protein